MFEFSLPDFSYAFVSVVLEGMPFILAGTLLAGFLDQFLPSQFMVKILPRRAAASIAVGAALGLILPMCECGVVPVIRRLIRKGLPVSSAIAYMLAAPVVNPIVIVSTYAAFKGQAALEMTLLRVGLAYLTACVVAMAAHTLPLERILRPGVLETEENKGLYQIQEFQGNPAPRGWLARTATALRVSVSDFLDVMVFFVLGVAVSSLVSTALNQEILLPLALDPWLATFSMMVLAFILALCSTSDAFIAATFITFPAYAKLAFLVLGPMLDLKLVFLYQTVFRKRFVAGMAVGLFVLVGLMSLRLGILVL